jgi:hypothetical protein
MLKISKVMLVLTCRQSAMQFNALQELFAAAVYAALSPLVCSPQQVDSEHEPACLTTSVLSLCRALR